MGGQSQRRRWCAYLTVGLCLGLCLAAVAAESPSGQPATLGAFASTYASLVGQPVKDEAAALEVLRQAGVRLPAGTSATSPLTEGLLVDILKQLGLRVTTQKPQRNLTRGELNRFVQTLGSELVTRDGSTGPDPRPEHHKDEHGTDPLTKGKGKKKGLRSPKDPA